MFLLKIYFIFNSLPHVAVGVSVLVSAEDRRSLLEVWSCRWLKATKHGKQPCVPFKGIKGSRPASCLFSLSWSCFHLDIILPLIFPPASCLLAKKEFVLERVGFGRKAGVTSQMGTAFHCKYNCRTLGAHGGQPSQVLCALYCTYGVLRAPWGRS